MANSILLDRIQLLCDEQGISKRELAHRVGISSGTIYNWKTSEPRFDTIQNIAKYFNVRYEYLTGMDNNRTIEDCAKTMSSTKGLFTEDEIELASKFSMLNTDGQDMILKLAEDISMLPKYQSSVKGK